MQSLSEPKQTTLRNATDHDLAEILVATMRKLPQIDIPTDHTFGPGFYARTIKVEKGSTIAGRVHKTEHIFIISEGEMLLFAEGQKTHVKAPFQIVSKPGVSRIGHALTDVVCTNIHLTTETDLEKLECMLVEPDNFEKLSAEVAEALEV